jgi:signal transduction histidine kinase
VNNLTEIRRRIPPGTYQTEQIPNSGSFVMVEVRDTGIGIPKDALGSIFDKFVQARNRREGKIKGTGLGLAFCRKVMDAHGGLLWAESELGKGSVFTVLFPMDPAGRAGA